MVVKSDNPYVHNLEIKRHWHAQSEAYTGGDSLYTALQNGWDVVAVLRELHEQNGRQVIVFCFDLKRGHEMMKMQVIRNPYIVRLISQLALCVIDAKPNRSWNVNQALV